MRRTCQNGGVAQGLEVRCIAIDLGQWVSRNRGLGWAENRWGCDAAREALAIVHVLRGPTPIAYPALAVGVPCFIGRTGMTVAVSHAPLFPYFAPQAAVVHCLGRLHPTARNFAEDLRTPRRCKQVKPRPHEREHISRMGSFSKRSQRLSRSFTLCRLTVAAGSERRLHWPTPSLRAQAPGRPEIAESLGSVPSSSMPSQPGLPLSS